MTKEEKEIIEYCERRIAEAPINNSHYQKIIDSIEKKYEPTPKTTPIHPPRIRR